MEKEKNEILLEYVNQDYSFGCSWDEGRLLHVNLDDIVLIKSVGCDYTLAYDYDDEGYELIDDIESIIDILKNNEINYVLKYVDQDNNEYDDDDDAINGENYYNFDKKITLIK